MSRKNWEKHAKKAYIQIEPLKTISQILQIQKHALIWHCIVFNLNTSSNRKTNPRSLLDSSLVFRLQTGVNRIFPDYSRILQCHWQTLYYIYISRDYFRFFICIEYYNNTHKSKNKPLKSMDYFNVCMYKY